MDDLRVLWVRDRVYTALGLTDPQLFEELLSRDDGEAEDRILHFLNRTSEEEAAATLFFYRTVVPEEVELEVEAGEPARRGGCPGPGARGQRGAGDARGERGSRGSRPCPPGPLERQPWSGRSQLTL